MKSQNSLNNNVSLEIEVVDDNTDLSKLDNSKIYMKQSTYNTAINESKNLGMSLEIYLEQLLKAEIVKNLNSKGVDMSVDQN